jgi:hypothetical protein
MEQHVYEGTPAQLMPHLVEQPNRRFRLIELPDEPLPDPENAASIALLKAWLEEDATEDPQELRQAEAELEEFKRNMNQPRKAAGARLLYPEVE